MGKEVEAKFEGVGVRLWKTQNVRLNLNNGDSSGFG